jgi:pilus assembly protein CpaF
VVELLSVTSSHREDYRLERLMHFAPDPLDAHRRVTGTFVHHRLPSALLHRIRLSGGAVPEEFVDGGQP